MMKQILTASAVAMFAASPAAAAIYGTVKTGEATPNMPVTDARAGYATRGAFIHPLSRVSWAQPTPFRFAAAPSTGGHDAYAYAPADGIASSPVVIEYGEVIGADPDANVRLQMSRDAAMTTSPY